VRNKKQDFEHRYERYSDEGKSIIENHVNRAIKNTDDSEFDLVLAINNYLFQYLILKDHCGSAVEVLSDGHAICGASAYTMCEMLYSLGIKSRKSYLFGIPAQGSHVLVEVIFKDGQRGCFDPTFGLFWYDSKGNKTLSIYELLDNPLLAKTMLYCIKKGML